VLGRHVPGSMRVAVWRSLPVQPSLLCRVKLRHIQELAEGGGVHSWLHGRTNKQTLMCEALLAAPQPYPNSSNTSQIILNSVYTKPTASSARQARQSQCPC
jgi:DNA polymerase III psi subunit